MAAMPENVVDAVEPLLERKEAVPLVHVGEEKEEPSSALPLRDLNAKPQAANGTSDRTHQHPRHDHEKEHGDEERDDDDDEGSLSDISLYEELLDDTEPYQYIPGHDICTPEESRNYLKLLREVGVDEFVNQTISQGTISAKKLCTAFGITPPAIFQDLPDTSYYKLLGYAISRQLAKREKLQHINTIDDAAKLLQDSKNILVITGAGISTSLGIPDFRSKETGFYSKLREQGFEEPEELFELTRFDEDPRLFYQFAGETLPDFKEWTPTHQFIKLLQDKGKLLRNYTQNIDNIESIAGIEPEKLVQCHGSWATATCRKCMTKVRSEAILEDVKAKRVPKCKECVKNLALPRPVMKRKRSSRENSKARKRGEDYDSDSDGQYDIPEPGVMKPDITFFGEPLPNRFFDLIKDVDSKIVDLVIVIGTGLKVAPVSELPGFLGSKVPHIFVSLQPIHHITFDINLLGYCDVVVTEWCKRAGWDLNHKMIPKNQQIAVETESDQSWTHHIKASSLHAT